MTHTPIQNEALQRQITAAFGPRVRPDDAALVPADVAAQPGGDLESEALACGLRGQPWQRLDVAAVRMFKDALPLFEPAAFAYYLPAWLMACLQAPAEVDSALDSVIFNLTPPSRQRDWQSRFFAERAHLFTPAETTAIAAFLAYEQAREQADWASAGVTPPPERLGRPLAHWSAAALAAQAGPADAA